MNYTSSKKPFSYRTIRPPKVLLRARLDNIAIVPASMLLQNKEYKTVANELPIGSVLICTPKKLKLGKMLESVAGFFRKNGYLVTTIPITRFSVS